jgi:hypothetical protein
MDVRLGKKKLHPAVTGDRSTLPGMLTVHLRSGLHPRVGIWPPRRGYFLDQLPRPFKRHALTALLQLQNRRYAVCTTDLGDLERLHKDFGSVAVTACWHMAYSNNLSDGREGVARIRTCRCSLSSVGPLCHPWAFFRLVAARPRCDWRCRPDRRPDISKSAVGR